MGWSELRKFIITNDGDLIYGGFVDSTPYLHKDLLPKGDHDCYGGGFMTVNIELHQVRFFGSSMDFGSPRFDKWTQSFMLDEPDWEYFYAPTPNSPYEKLDISKVEFF